MLQTYLDIARKYVEGRGTSTPVILDKAAVVLVELVPGTDTSTDWELPVSIAAYRASTASSRCRLCGIGMSVIAVRDICGRCAASELMPQPVGNPETLTSPLDDERQLRGRMLAALDRRGYPRLVLIDGTAAGPGLLHWGPLLREMDFDDLRHLENTLARSGNTEVEVPGS